MKWPAIVYVFLIGLVSLHFYQKPDWNMDMIGYMGNALMTNHTPIEKAHQLVYAEVRRLPRDSQIPLVGVNTSGDPTQDVSRRLRAEHVENFAEFLPCFAIRPVYNQLLFLSSRIFGLVPSAVLLSVCSYFLLGILVFSWACHYVGQKFAAVFSLLLMLMAPIAQMGRTPISDAFSTLMAAFALYLVFERKREAVGLALLLISIFARTDNIVLASPVLVALWLLNRLRFWQMAILGILSAASVIFINRMAGDYGLAMLYYRNFVGTPAAPAEMVVHFSVGQYIQALRASVVVMLQGWLTPFLLLAFIGFFRGSRLTPLSVIAVIYVVLHFLILPNWVERWFVIAYVPMALSAVCVAAPPDPPVCH